MASSVGSIPWPAEPARKGCRGGRSSSGSCASLLCSCACSAQVHVMLLSVTGHAAKLQLYSSVAELAV